MAWLTVLGVPAAVYIASIVVLAFRIVEKPVDLTAVFGSICLTLGLYIFHRTHVKTCDLMQQRHQLASKYTTQLRITAALLLGITTVFFWFLHSVVMIIVALAFAGMYIYRRPIRNIMLLKPLAVGCSISGFAWILTGYPTEFEFFIAIAFICSADALVCDLDDCAYDTQTGCNTMAARLGVLNTWLVASLVYSVAAGGILYLFGGSMLGLYLCLVFPIPLLSLKHGVRTLVDVRPFFALMLAWAI